MRVFLPLAIGFSILLLDGYDLQSVSFVLPELVRVWHLEASAFGPVFAAGLAGTIPGAILSGPVVRAFGHRRALGIALIVFGIGSLITAQATSVAALIPIRFVVGLGLGASVPIVMTAVLREAPHRLRATLVTLTLCGQAIGAMVGAAICARLIPSLGWQSVFWIGGISPLLLVPCVLAFRPSGVAAAATENRFAEQVSSKATRLFAKGQLPVTLALWASTFLAAFVVYVVVNWLPAIVRSAGHSHGSSMLAIALFNFGGVIGAVVIGALADRWGPLCVIASAFALATAALLVQAFSHDSLPLFLTACALTGIAGYGGAISLGPLAVLQYPAELATAGAGWALAVGRLGGALSPLAVSALLAGGTAGTDLFVLAALGALLAALSVRTLSRIGMSDAALPQRATRDVRLRS